MGEEGDRGRVRGVKGRVGMGQKAMTPFGNVSSGTTRVSGLPIDLCVRAVSR